MMKRLIHDYDIQILQTIGNLLCRKYAFEIIHHLTLVTLINHLIQYFVDIQQKKYRDWYIDL